MLRSMLDATNAPASGLGPQYAGTTRQKESGPRWPAIALLDGAGRTWLQLALAVMLPLLLFAGWAAYFTADRARAASRQAADATVERVAERIATEIASQLEAAEALAVSTTLDRDDLEAFRIEAERLKEKHSLWHTIELASPSGMQVLNLLRASGSELGGTADRASFDQVIDTGLPAVGGVGPVGVVSGRRLITLRVPVRRQNAVRYVLSIAVAPDSVGAILRKAGAPPGWMGEVVDASSHIVARSGAEETIVGEPASVTVRQPVATAPSGSFRGRTTEGLEVETAYRTLPGVSGWTVYFGIPSATLQTPVNQALVLLAGGGVAGLLLAAFLISMVARDLAQRRTAERERAALALQASEERRALAVEAAELGTWLWQVETDMLESSEQCRKLLHARQGNASMPRSDALASVHPDDRPSLDAALDGCRADQGTIDVEFRVAGDHEGLRWLRFMGRASQVAPDRLRSVRGVAADITARKRADAERTDLLRRLAQAQEEERRRIARELHDQVGQTVTGLSLGLKALEDTLTSTRPYSAHLERVRWLRACVSDIGRDIHHLAADLRPAALDDLGLQAAVAAQAADWSDRYAIVVDVQAVGFIGRLPPEVETVAYRVIQEAQTNVLKHAKARTLSIVMERRPAQLRLIVEDDGIGFDPDAVGGEPYRLGLSGIRERLSLVGGSLLLEAAPGAGTTLFMQIPLSAPGLENVS